MFDRRRFLSSGIALGGASVVSNRMFAYSIAAKVSAENLLGGTSCVRGGG
jgi:hypothetical protein